MSRLSDAFKKDRTNLFLKNAIKRTDEATQYQNSRLGYAMAGMNPNNEWARIPGIDPMMESGDVMASILSSSNPDTSLEISKLGKFSSAMKKKGNVAQAEFDVANPAAPKTGMGFTTGDIVGTVGSVVGSVSQMFNTIANAKATKPVVNHYAGFNEKALNSNRSAKDELGYREAEAKTELQRNIQTGTNTARARTRGGASGMNTMRALDLGVDVNSQEAVAKGTAEINGSFSQQLMQLLGVDTQLLSEKDRMVMGGQTAADEANAQNLDSFYTNFAQNIAGATTTIQKLGADINTNKYNNDVLKLIPSSNKWGVGVDANMNTYSTYTKPDKYAPIAQGIREQGIPNFNYLSEILNT